MSEHSTKSKPVDDEIDLGVVFEGIQNFLKKILKGVFNIISFFYRHKYVLIGLIVLGGVLGYFYDKNAKKTYTNDILVSPNFSSSDYLYTKIESLNKKLSSDDTLFLKNLFGKHYKNVKSIEIKPVIDIYNFVSRNETNKDLFELLFEEEASMEFIENPINSRNFNFHHIYIKIDGSDYHRELSKALLNYINKNAYFDDIRNLSLDNLNLQIQENNMIIRQIDSIIAFAQKDKSLSLGGSELSFSDNSGLNDLLIQKKTLIVQQKDLRAGIVNQEETIKIVDVNYKVLDDDFLNKEKTKLFPLLFILIYSFVFLFRYISKKAKTIIS